MIQLNLGNNRTADLMFQLHSRLKETDRFRLEIGGNIVCKNYAFKNDPDGTISFVKIDFSSLEFDENEFAFTIYRNDLPVKVDKIKVLIQGEGVKKKQTQKRRKKK